MNKNLNKTFTLQHDQTDCGVACLLSLVQYYGSEQSLEKLRELSGTNTEGTTLLGLYQAANQIGFDAEGCEADMQSLIEHGKPVILHIVQEKHLNHYIVCYGYADGKFIIGDPAKGIIHYTKEELDSLWQTKACLTLSPNETFVKTQTSRKKKWKWFAALLKEDRKLLSFSVLLGLIIATLGLAMAIFSQKLIDDILPSKEIQKLIAGIVLLTFLLFVRVGLEAVRSLFLIRQTYDFNNRIIDKFYSSLLSLPKLFFDTRKIGELVARLNDTQRVQRVILSVVGGTVIDMLTVLVSFSILFFYSWQVGVIAFVSLPFYFLLMYAFNRRIINTQREVMQGYALNESNYIATMQGIATIKNSNRIPFFRQLNRLIYGSYQEKIVKLGKINVRLSVLSGIFGVAFLIVILSYTSFLVLNEQMRLGELMAILGISGALLPAVAGLALIAIPINEAKVAFNRMYEFASLKPEEAGTISLRVKPTMTGDFQTMEVKHLASRFAGQKQLLKDISLTVQKGECVAIVGESGCGKSTFVQVLQKFYPFESGAVTINKTIGLKDLKTEDWRNIVGVVPQDIAVFNGNVIDNILLGKEDTPENIEKFIIESGFMPFIQSLPQGFATILGEEGINLSGGQKQLLALMRVLYRKPQLLILDEFTSGMDRNTERFALQLLNKIKPSVAILFVSHRLNSLKNIADKIYIFDKGIVPHFGTHEELLQIDNFYSDYWKQLE
ncbi:MAG: peptidase domain-containing ABC transporter [Dysgonamonadaceae bacterium]|jgi:ATP-binding cassette subfamily B protein|nr:peptidase domain-containing ABC transporter [Dysgonamonadaceae bacterium]